MSIFEKKMLRLFLYPFIFFVYPSSCFCVSVFNHLLYEEDEKVVPWFTGPLLAVSANTIPPKHINIEPYVFFTAFTASYDSNWHKVSHPNFYSLVAQNFIQVGINSFMSCQVAPQLLYQFCCRVAPPRDFAGPVS